MKTQLYLAYLLCIVGMALLWGGFFSPPLGKIDSSILVVFGEVLTFVGALLGIDYHYQIKNK